MAETTTTIVGNATDAPELRFTPNGVAVATVSIAVTPRVRVGEEWQDGDASFFRVTMWRQLAENAAEAIGKGSRVIVFGHLKQKTWENAEGQKRSSVEIDAIDIGMSVKFAHKKRSSVMAPEFTDEPPF